MFTGDSMAKPYVSWNLKWSDTMTLIGFIISSPFPVYIQGIMVVPIPIFADAGNLKCRIPIHYWGWRCFTSDGVKQIGP
jgi:hypothetical protein